MPAAVCALAYWEAVREFRTQEDDHRSVALFRLVVLEGPVLDAIRRLLPRS